MNRGSKLGHFEIEDLEMALEKFEKDYQILIDERIPAKNFQELTDYLLSKFEVVHREGCTTQQAFYKLKNAMEKNKILASFISPQSLLEEVFSREERKQNLKYIEGELGVKLDVLRPKNWLIYGLMLMFFMLLISLFWNFWWGLLGLGIWYILSRIIFQQGNEFKIKTMGDLVKIMVRGNYFQSRRNAQSMNREEFKAVVLDYFSEEMCMEKEELSRAVFV